jgi:hypothetical protein
MHDVVGQSTKEKIKKKKNKQPVFVDISEASVRAAWMSFRALLSVFMSNEVKTYVMEINQQKTDCSETKTYQFHLIN